MIRLVLLLGWLRWRSFANGLVPRRKRSKLQRLSSWLEAGASGLVLFFAMLLLLALGAAGFAAGLAVARGGIEMFRIGLIARMLCFASFGLALITPLQGAPDTQAPTRLLLLPVSRRALHAAAVLGGLGDPVVLLAAPAVLMLPAGLLAGGRPLAAALALLAGLALVAILAGFDAAASAGAQLVLRDRRRGEAAALLALLLVTGASFLPALMASRIDEDEAPAHAAAVADRFGSAGAIEEMFGALDALPPGLHARALQRAVDGEPLASLAFSGALLAVAAAVIAASSALHARLLAEPGRTSRRRAAAAFPARDRVPPGLTAATLAMASATARTVLRTVRGKLTVFSPALLAGLMSFVLTRMDDDLAFIGVTLAASTGVFGWAVALSLLNLQPVVLNAFATDRAGLTLTLLQPVSARDVVRGKVAGLGLLWGASLALALPVAVLVGTPASLPEWLTALACALAAFLLHAPVSLILSAVFPKAADLSQISGQQPHAAGAVLGLVSLLAAMALPRLAAFAGGLAAGAWGAPAAALLWAGVAAALAMPLTSLAAEILDARREAIALAATGH